MSAFHLLVAGSANLDFVVRAASIPVPGETVLGRDFATFPGGKGANQAVACARAGGAGTRMLLALGDDDYARVLEDSLRDAGVVLHVVRSERPTGAAFICVADNAENAITVAPGANATLASEHLPSLDGVSWLLLQLETPLETVHDFAVHARAAGVHVALNAAPAQALPDLLLNALDLLIVNEGELTALAGDDGEVVSKLSRLRVPSVVVTLGSQGCIAKYRGELLEVPAFPVKVVDTTAAGDTFCGALVARLAQGDAMRDGLRYASAAAALACTRAGAQASVPVQAEVEAMLR
ncbi:MAG: ribokinase [Pseudoxanthomonas sp.]